jgi:hypothetical protein
MIDLQPAQRIFHHTSDGRWRTVQSALAVDLPQHAFARQGEFTPAIHQRSAQQLLIRPEPIKGRRIEECHAYIQRMAQ